MVFVDEILWSELQIGTEAIFWALKNIKLGVEIDLPLVPLSSETRTKDPLKLVQETKSFRMLIHCSSVTSVIKYLSAKESVININLQPVCYKIFKGWWVWSAQLSAQRRAPSKAGCWMMEQMHKIRWWEKMSDPSAPRGPGYTALRLQLVTSG